MFLSNKKISFKLITLISILIGFLNVSAQFQINGSASQIDCKCYQLTSNISNQAG